MRRLRTLQTRLAAWVMIGVAAVWLAATVATAVDARHELDELLDSHLAQAAALLVARQAGELDEGDDDRRLDAPQLHRYATRTAFQVWHEGRLVLRSSNAPAQPMATHDAGFADARFDGRDWRVFAARGREDDIVVYVGEQHESRQDILAGLLRGLLGPMALALPLLGLGVWWAVRGGLAPLRRLGEAVAARDPRALQPIAGTAAAEGMPGEVAPLVRSLDALFARIATLLEAERRFTADAAHELRTPIAAIRAQAQVALGAGDDEAARRHALQALLAGCDRATRLVEQLLTLARVEAGAATAQERCDVAALAREVLAELAPAALARGQDLSLDAPASLPPLRGNPVLLRVLLRNLVDNALRHAPPQGRVDVQLAARADGGVRLQIDDAGPGLDEAGLARLGERFFRVPDQEAPGSGLGWSIVRRIAQAHGATVAAGRSPLGGLRVTVDLPA